MLVRVQVSLLRRVKVPRLLHRRVFLRVLPYPQALLHLRLYLRVLVNHLVRLHRRRFRLVLRYLQVRRSRLLLLSLYL